MEYRSHIVALDLFCCHCRRSYLSGITFLQLCRDVHSSLNKADHCGSPSNGRKKINKTWGGSHQWISGSWHRLGESGAEASDVEDYFEEEEVEQLQHASAEVAITNTGHRKSPTHLRCRLLFYSRPKKGHTMRQMWRGTVRGSLFRGISHKNKFVIYCNTFFVNTEYREKKQWSNVPLTLCSSQNYVMNYLQYVLYNTSNSQA